MGTRRRRKDIKVHSDRVKQLIAARMAQKLKGRPEVTQKLIDAGLLPPDALEGIEQDFDLSQFIAQVRDQIAERARAEPSFLSELNMSRVEMLAPAPQEETSNPKLDQTPRAVVFSDLEGFTKWTAEHGDLDAGALLTDHYDSVEAVVKSRGGRVVKTIGDGHMLAFREPAAAVMAAAELPMTETGPLRLRVGAHHGPVVDTGNDLLGHVVNVASRVADLAPGGVTLATTELRDSAGTLPAIRFGEPRAEQLAGITEPITICELTRA